MRPLKTLVTTGLTGLALAGTVVLSAAAPASAAAGVDEIVEACGSQPVCQVDGAAISNATELGSELPQGVQVIVIPPPDQAESVPTTTLATQVHSATGADTVIMIEDRPAADRFAVASDGDARAITESLYSQNQPDGGLAVSAIAQTLTSGDTPVGTDSAAGGGILIIGVALALVLGAAGTATVLLLRRRRRRSERISPQRVRQQLADALHGEDGELVRDAIGELRDRAAAYPDIGGRIEGLAGHVSELFIRLRKRGTDQQIRLMQAKYKDTLTKLLKALSDDYYGDITRNPQFWSQADARLEEVRRAVDSVDSQAVENIRQVNESRDLEFQVALDSLIRTVSEAKLSDVYSDRADNTASDRAGGTSGDRAGGTSGDRAGGTSGDREK